MRSPWKSSLFVLAVVALGFGLAACGDTAGATAPEATAVEEGGQAPKSTDGASVLADPTAAAGAIGATGAAGAEKCASEKCSGACSKTDGSKSDCCKQQPASDAPACLCAKGEAGSAVWCERCDKGYVDGKEVCCPSCVKDALKKQAKAGTQ